ncbi:unnamed protein product, partial [Prorocentrum cordatum]
MAIPSWSGKAETLEGYAIAVELLTLGSSREVRPLLGPRLVAPLPQGSAQQRFALRLPREAGFDLDRAPLEQKSIATVDGPNNLIEAFRRELGSQVVSDIGEKTDAYFYAGPGRSALTRRLGQSMAQWIEAEQEAYDQLQRTCRQLVPDVGGILPSAVRGALFWRNSNLDSSERAVVRSTIKGDWKLENGTDHELPPDECVQADEEDVAALEEHEALAVQEADAATRAWEEARKLLSDVSRARGYYPVVGLAALPPTWKGAGKGARGGPKGRGRGDKGAPSPPRAPAGQARDRPGRLQQGRGAGVKCLACRQLGRTAVDCPSKYQTGGRGNGNMNIGYEEADDETVDGATVSCVSYWESADEWVLAISLNIALGLSFFAEADLRGYAIVGSGATKSTSGLVLFEFAREQIYGAHGQGLTDMNAKERARFTYANNTTGMSVGGGGIPHSLGLRDQGGELWFSLVPSESPMLLGPGTGKGAKVTHDGCLEYLGGHRERLEPLRSGQSNPEWEKLGEHPPAEEEYDLSLEELHYDALEQASDLPADADPQANPEQVAHVCMEMARSTAHEEAALWSWLGSLDRMVALAQDRKKWRSRGRVLNCSRNGLPKSVDGGRRMGLWNMHDFQCAGAVAKAEAFVEARRPRRAHVSPPCTPFSAQALDQESDQQVTSPKKKIASGTKLMDNVIEVGLHALRKVCELSLEQPANATSWWTAQSLMNLRKQLCEATAAECAWGARDSETGQAARANWRPPVPNQRPAGVHERKCPRERARRQLEGPKRVADTAKYPEALCRALSREVLARALVSGTTAGASEI